MKRKIISFILLVFIGVSSLQAQQVWNYSYTGSVQQIVLPAGKYKFEAWGAQGGSGGWYSNSSFESTGGKGGYAVGELTLSSSQTVYVYVGGAGEGFNNGQYMQSLPVRAGGWNGGGNSFGGTFPGTGGGGATDFRTSSSSNPMNSTSLSSRFLVAGGGGGGGNSYSGTQLSDGGAGGGTNGVTMPNATQFVNRTPGSGGTQNSGNALGQGQNGTTNLSGGGGGGYYGGESGQNSTGGGGGSGYVGSLSNASLIAGNTSMPNPSGGTMTGKAGNGSARITQLYSVSVLETGSISCNGNSTGALTAIGSGGTTPYTFLWSTGSTSTTISGLSAGTYTITLSDANSITTTTTYTLTEPTALVSANALDSNVSCNGGSDGGATASATGGIGTYNYLWSNGATTASIIGVSSGTYTATVTDVNGCTSSTSVIVTEPTVLTSASVLDSNVSCNGGSDGGATASATGGTGTYNYLWSNGATTASLSGVSAGTYTATVTDVNGCTSSTSVNVTEPDSLVIGLGQDSTICFGDSTGQAYLTSIQGGTSPYSIQWATGAVTDTIAVPAGFYSVVVIDNNGCEISDSVEVQNSPSMVLSLDVTDATCQGGNDGTITASTIGGNGNVAYAWSTGSMDSIIDSLFDGFTYSVIASDTLNCQVTDSATISYINLNPIVDLGADTAVLVPSAMELKTGVFGNHLWSTGDTIDTLNFLVETDTTIWVYVSDSNGCSSTDTIFIDGVVGIEGTKMSYSIKLFPNPTQGEIHLQMQDLNAKSMVIHVLDISGRQVYSETVENPNHQYHQTLDLSNTGQGVYFIVIDVDGKRHTQRITKF